MQDLREKEGGSKKSKPIFEDFNEFIDQLHLSKPFNKRGLYTWTNNKSDDHRI